MQGTGLQTWESRKRKLQHDEWKCYCKLVSMTVTGIIPLPLKHFLCLLLPNFDVSILMHGKGCMCQAWHLKSLLSLDNCLNWTLCKNEENEFREMTGSKILGGRELNWATEGVFAHEVCILNTWLPDSCKQPEFPTKRKLETSASYTLWMVFAMKQGHLATSCFLV